MCRCWRWSGIAEVMVARLWRLWWNICIITKIFTQWRRLPLIIQVDIGGKNKHNKTSCTCLRLLLLYKIELNVALLWSVLRSIVIICEGHHHVYRDDSHDDKRWSDNQKSYCPTTSFITRLPKISRCLHLGSWKVESPLMARQDLLMAAQELDLPLARDVVHAH